MFLCTCPASSEYSRFENGDNLKGHRRIVLSMNVSFVSSVKEISQKFSPRATVKIFNAAVLELSQDNETRLIYAPIAGFSFFLPAHI